ncbi:MAG: hypothetical protein RR954_01050 [Christensenellaceae bacterium]
MSEENKNHLRENCPIADSDLCNWLDRTGCYNCYISTLKSDEQKAQAQERWNTTLSLIPKNIDDLHMTDECQFCKGEPEKINGYATFELANPEPYSEKGMFFGIGKKVRTPIGSLLTLQAGICPKCRKAFKMADVLQLGIFFGFIALSVILLMIPAFSQPLSGVFILMPMIFVVLMGGAGFLLGKKVSEQHMKKAAKTVKVDITEIPQIKEMMNNNWFFFQTTNGVPRVFFSKKKQYKMLRQNCKQIEEDDDATLDNINI